MSDPTEAPAQPRRYERIITYISETAWAIHPAVLATMVAIVAERRSGHRPSQQEIRERVRVNRLRTEVVDVDLPEPEEPEDPERGVAIIPLSGVIVPKADLFTELSGGTSVEGFQAAFREALEAEDVRAIVIDVDSPGGSVDLVDEMATEIFEARGSKPIVAVANTWAASAAYYIASAAEELVITPSGQVGSIGVWSAHDDISAAMAMAGIKTTLISAGAFKVEGNPFEPLGDEAREEMQRVVDAYYRMFLEAVARNRGVSVGKVEADFGQGRMVLALDAVTVGMADRVATLSQTVARLASGGVEASPEATPAARAASVLHRRAREPQVLPVRGGNLRQVRSFPSQFELRNVTAESATVVGYATVWGTPYLIEGWCEYEEEFVAGAFTKTLQDGADVRMFYNHEGMVLARTKAGTLKVSEDDHGLHYEGVLDRRQTAANDLVIAIEIGNVAESSLAFRVMKDGERWEFSKDPNVYDHRWVTGAQLYDTSPVAFPANPDASAGLRMAAVIDLITRARPERIAAELRQLELRGVDVPAALAKLEEILGVGLAGGKPAGERDEPSTISVEAATRELELLRLRG